MSCMGVLWKEKYMSTHSNNAVSKSSYYPFSKNFVMSWWFLTEVTHTPPVANRHSHRRTCTQHSRTLIHIGIHAQRNFPIYNINCINNPNRIFGQLNFFAEMTFAICTGAAWEFFLNTYLCRPRWFLFQLISRTVFYY